MIVIVTGDRYWKDLGSKWGIFKVNEEIKNIYNGTYHSLLLFLGNKKCFGTDDIKKWMEL